MSSLMGMGLVGQMLGKGDGGSPLGLIPGLMNRKKKAADGAGGGGQTPSVRPTSTILTDALQRRRGG